MSNIPQIIHYCWFGDGEIPQKEQKCIETWKEKFPEYKLMLWNEDNFDIEQCVFVKQAYESKEYAFVSDYARTKVLYEFGGLYLDTDVEVKKDFPDSEYENGFMGFERRKFLGTAVMASVPKNEIILKLVRFYEKQPFLQKNGDRNIIANVSLLTDIMVEEGLVLGGSEQDCGGFHIYPREYFYPKKTDTGEFLITEKTCAIHRCHNSWMTEREKRRGTNILWIKIARPILQRIRKIGIKILGKDRIKKLEIKLRNKLR